jgi:hypothetical protein
LRLSDDQLFLKTVRFEEMAPLHLGDLASRDEKYFSGSWKRKLKATRDHLQSKGFGAIHFDAHAPAPYDRESFQRVMAEHPWRETPMTIGTLYFNAARGPRYENFLVNARPKFLPRKYHVKLICTARLEKWRPQTEEWLRRHGHGRPECGAF